MTPELIIQFYSLKLHETLEIPGEDAMVVMRVPGGWIYYSPMSSGVFVPFSSEFNK